MDRTINYSMASTSRKKAKYSPLTIEADLESKEIKIHLCPPTRATTHKHKPLDFTASPQKLIKLLYILPH